MPKCSVPLCHFQLHSLSSFDRVKQLNLDALDDSFGLRVMVLRSTMRWIWKGTCFKNGKGVHVEVAELNGLGDKRPYPHFSLLTKVASVRLRDKSAGCFKLIGSIYWKQYLLKCVLKGMRDSAKNKEYCY